MPNPYHLRNAIRDDRHFVGRRRELDELFALAGAEQPQSVAVVGDRRIGKSSLLQALYRRLRDSDDTIVAYQDVNGLSSSEDVLSALIDNLSVAGHVDPETHAPSLYTSLRRLVGHFSKTNRRVIILLDEFDTITRNPSFPVTFFNFLRSLANEFPVALVLSAAKKLKDICHSEEVAGSPFFNIFHERRLGCFTEAEARLLIAGPSAQAGKPLEGAAQEIIDYVGRWPLFIQIMCYWMLECSDEGVGRADSFGAAKGPAKDEITQHLSGLWRQMSPLEREACSRILGGASIAGVPAGVLDSLVVRGLISKDAGGDKRLAFELFQEYVSRPETSLPPPAGPRSGGNGTVRVFVSYCHRDWRVIDKFGLVDFLRDLEVSDGFKVWIDRDLRTGDPWDEVLSRQLNESEVMVALVTPEYLRSRYCQEVEIKQFWQRRVKDGLVLFPILVSACDWDRQDWLQGTQFMPRNGRVMADYQPSKRQRLILEAVNELREIGKKVKARQK